MQLRLLQIPAVLSDRAYDRNFLAFELRLALLMSRRLTHEGYHKVLPRRHTFGLALVVDRGDSIEEGALVRIARAQLATLVQAPGINLAFLVPRDPEASADRELIEFRHILPVRYFQGREESAVHSFSPYEELPVAVDCS